jgi:hypothetical protein
VSIPVLREVCYTDDGCTVYECLYCYKRIETRNDPFRGFWKYCPYCSCAWQIYLPEEYERTRGRCGCDLQKENIRPLFICNFELWSRVKMLGEWMDWEKETYGHKEWVVRRKNELKEVYEKDTMFDEYEFKYKVVDR